MKNFALRAVRLLLILDGFFAGIPQIGRILTRHTSADVSVLSWAWMAVMACLWVYQGYRDKSPVLLWSSAIWGLNNAAVAVVALIYQR